MESPIEKIKIRNSYNLSALSFTPKEIADEIAKQMPDFNMSYAPDFRQEIADSWPASINDSEARKNWGWQEDFNLEAMVSDMLKNIKKQVSVS